MKHPALSRVIADAHTALHDRVDAATTAVLDHVGRRETMQKTDAFMIHTCRHISAVCNVLLPAARTQLPDGQERVHAYVRQARRVERSVVRTKQRLYGESHKVDLSWSDVWFGLAAEVDHLAELERDLVADLSPGLAPAADRDLANRVEAGEITGPTRAHPHSPHTGPFGRMSRGFLARTDRFWDATEGRIAS